MGFLQTIYNHSPEWFQNLGISLYGVMWQRRRFGGVFQEERKGFLAREKYGLEQWNDYQTRALRQLLRGSYENVPYYTKLFKSIGIGPHDLEKFNLKDLSKIPLLEKDMIRKEPLALLSKKVPSGKLHSYLTSGTTGTPLAIYFTDEMHQKWSAAYEVRCRNWAGVHNQMKRAMIGGRLVVPKANAKPPFWRCNAAEKQLYFSAFHISPENMPYYVKALNDFKPDYLVGYASAYYFLARMIAGQNLNVHSPKAVLTSSEKLTHEMREMIEKVYHCPVFDAYSGVEACGLASECEQHQMHVSPDVGIIELIDEEGCPAAPGKMGEIIATGLLNEAQPLIRYRTGDYAIWSDRTCACGRKMPVLKELIGRLEDAVVGRDGREMVRFHGIFIGISKIKEGQIIQETLSSFKLKLAADAQLNEQEKTLIQKRFEERLGEIQLCFEYVEQIERTERGKFRAVISKVKREAVSP